MELSQSHDEPHVAPVGRGKYPTAKIAKPKSQLYLELLPRLCSGEIELLDNETLISQLAGLERRTRSGGRDFIDHGSNQHDDVANVVAGVAVCVVHRPIVLRPVLGVDSVGGGDSPAARFAARKRQYEEEQRIMNTPDRPDEEWRREMVRVGRAPASVLDVQREYLDNVTQIFRHFH